MPMEDTENSAIARCFESLCSCLGLDASFSAACLSACVDKQISDSLVLLGGVQRDVHRI